jgi:hypothetical protein
VSARRRGGASLSPPTDSSSFTPSTRVPHRSLLRRARRHRYHAGRRTRWPTRSASSRRRCPP